MYHAIIVDDDKWTLEDIKRSFHFESNGFDLIAECTSAEDALPEIITHSPELVITDIRMERDSGLDLIRRCREKGIHSFFIILSGYDKFEYAKEAIHQGAFYYMLKPIDDREAQQVMHQITDILSGRQEKPSSSPPTVKEPGGEKTDSFKQIINYLEYHCDDSSVNLDILSETFFVNRTYICDMFRKRLDKTFTQYFTELRMKKACELLKKEVVDLGSVAARVGYEDPGYFSRVFKKTMGMLPMQYHEKFNKQ